MIETPPAACADERVYDANGVDRTLVRWMLGLSPDARLAYVQASIDLQRTARRLHDADRPDSRDAR